MLGEYLCSATSKEREESISESSRNSPIDCYAQSKSGVVDATMFEFLTVAITIIDAYPKG